MSSRAVVLLLLLSLFGPPAFADPLDEMARQIFDEHSDKIKIKPGYRGCVSEGDCTTILVLCRWRAVNTAAAKHVAEVASTVTSECKWPKPPAEPPVVHCTSKLCDIPPDGKYY